MTKIQNLTFKLEYFCIIHLNNLFATIEISGLWTLLRMTYWRNMRGIMIVFHNCLLPKNLFPCCRRFSISKKLTLVASFEASFWRIFDMINNEYVIDEDWKSCENPWPVRNWNPWLYHMLVTTNRFMIDYFDSWYRFDYSSFQSQIFLPKIIFLIPEKTTTKIVY